MTNPYSQIRKFALYSAVFCILSACGLKGDLYLPEALENTQPQVVDSTPVETTSNDETVEQAPEVVEADEISQPE